MTLRDFAVESKRHSEASFLRSKAMEGNLIPPAPFSSDIPTRKPIPDSEIETKSTIKETLDGNDKTVMAENAVAMQPGGT